MKRIKDPLKIMKFFDEAVMTKPRRMLTSILLCGFGATTFVAGIAIGIIKPEDTQNQKTEQQNDKNKKSNQINQNKVTALNRSVVKPILFGR